MNDEWQSVGVSRHTSQTWNLEVAEIIVTSTSVNLKWSKYSQVRHCEEKRKNCEKR